MTPLHSAPPADTSHDEYTSRLVVAARSGDRSALEQLVLRGLPDLERWAHRHLSPGLRQDMETRDLAQEVALATIGSLSRFKPEHQGSMPAFLRRVATNRVLDGYRKTVRRGECIALDEQMASRDSGPFELAVRRQQQARLRRAFVKLSAKDQRLIRARFVEQLSFKDIAQRLGLATAAAAGMAVRRAERRLRHELIGGDAKRS